MAPSLPYIFHEANNYEVFNRVRDIHSLNFEFTFTASSNYSIVFEICNSVQNVLPNIYASLQTANIGFPFPCYILVYIQFTLTVFDYINLQNLIISRL